MINVKNKKLINLLITQVSLFRDLKNYREKLRKQLTVYNNIKKANQKLKKII
jgi:hypothetical protein